MRILFVCTGNICRSPTAEAVMTSLVAEQGLTDQITLDSAGTGEWHIGHPPDRRSQETAAKRGYNMTDLRARAVVSEDFDRFDLILAMDRSHLSALQAMAPKAPHTARLALFLESIPKDQDPNGWHGRDMPDPYYGGQQGFDLVLDMVEEGARGLLQTLGLRS